MMLTNAVIEVIFSLMSLYIIYRSSDPMANLIYAATGLSALVFAAVSFSQGPHAIQSAYTMEHHMLQLAVGIRFMSVIQLKKDSPIKI